MIIPYSPPAILLDSDYIYSDRWNGLTICIENPKGSIRRGKGWSHKLHDDYGYIEGTVGADGDEVDCYLGPDSKSKVVYVVDQNRLDDSGEFDEHKTLLGYTQESRAKNCYITNHTEGARIFRSITELTLREFKNWLKNGDHSKPISESYDNLSSY